MEASNLKDTIGMKSFIDADGNVQVQVELGGVVTFAVDNFGSIACQPERDEAHRIHTTMDALLDEVKALVPDSGA